MTKNKGKIIGVCGNHSTTADMVLSLLDSGYQISCIINMKNDLNGKIAGYFDLKPIAKKYGIKIIRPHSYNLRDIRDQKLILKEKLDLLVVFGWQRLIPDWFLDNLSIGAFGSHGSSKKLPKGRGRSVLNWSLLTYQKKYIDNFFRYDVGVDSGDIIASQNFSINTWDTAASLHHKDQMVYKLLLLNYLPRILNGTFPVQPQSKGVKPTYYPKRTPEDGVLTWHWQTKWLYSLVRAVTKPYPGAFTYLGDQKVMIWQALPFENFPQLEKKKPGEVLEVFSDKTFLVKTGDSSLLVTDFEPAGWLPKKGDRFKSQSNMSFEKLKENNLWK